MSDDISKVILFIIGLVIGNLVGHIVAMVIRDYLTRRKNRKELESLKKSGRRL